MVSLQVKNKKRSATPHAHVVVPFAWPSYLLLLLFARFHKFCLWGIIPIGDEIILIQVPAHINGSGSWDRLSICVP